MFAETDERKIEQERLIAEVIEEQRLEANTNRAKLKTARDPEGQEISGVQFVKCGGGRRRVPHKSKAS